MKNRDKAIRLVEGEKIGARGRYIIVRATNDGDTFETQAVSGGKLTRLVRKPGGVYIQFETPNVGSRGAKAWSEVTPSPEFVFPLQLSSYKFASYSITDHTFEPVGFGEEPEWGSLSFSGFDGIASNLTIKFAGR